MIFKSHRASSDISRFIYFVALSKLLLATKFNTQVWAVYTLHVSDMDAYYTLNNSGQKAVEIDTSMFVTMSGSTIGSTIAIGQY